MKKPRRALCRARFFIDGVASYRSSRARTARTNIPSAKAMPASATSQMPPTTQAPTLIPLAMPASNRGVAMTATSSSVQLYGPSSLRGVSLKER